MLKTRTHSYAYDVTKEGDTCALHMGHGILPAGVFLVTLLDWHTDRGGNAILIEADSPSDAAEKRFKLLDRHALSPLSSREKQEVHVLYVEPDGFRSLRTETFTFLRTEWALV